MKYVYKLLLVLIGISLLVNDLGALCCDIMGISLTIHGCDYE